MFLKHHTFYLTRLFKLLCEILLWSLTKLTFKEYQICTLSVLQMNCIQMKFSHCQDLIQGAREGEDKKKIAATKVDALKAVRPQDRHRELDDQKQAAEVEFQDIMVAMKTTQYVLVQKYLFFHH